jgi:hypothetical protein
MPFDVVVSGSECVDALVRAGCRVINLAGRVTIVRCGLHVFAVPESRRLSPGALRAVLRSAGVTYPRFLEALGEDAPPSRRARVHDAAQG